MLDELPTTSQITVRKPYIRLHIANIQAFGPVLALFRLTGVALDVLNTRTANDRDTKIQAQNNNNKNEKNNNSAEWIYKEELEKTEEQQHEVVLIAPVYRGIFIYIQAGGTASVVTVSATVLSPS